MNEQERRKKRRTGGVSDFARKLLNKIVRENGLAGALLSDPEGAPISMVFDSSLVSRDNRLEFSQNLSKNIRTYFDSQLEEKKAQVFDLDIKGVADELCAVCKGLVAMDEYLILTFVGKKSNDYNSLFAEVTQAIKRIVDQEQS